MSPSPAAFDVDAIVVGAGFGGCGLLNLLRKQGFSTKIIEAADRLGGVWAWNCYPGARVDCEVPYYGFSDPAIWTTWTWNERFPSYEKLREYFVHVDKVWDLSKDIVLNTRVINARFQEGEKSHWLIETDDGKIHRCKWFIAATGTSFKQHIPDIKGRELFKGQIHHSSLWPKDGIDLKNKRIAVIGAGSTGVQIVQETAKVAKQLTQFIRTPNLAIPMRQRQVDQEEIMSNRQAFPILFDYCRKHMAGLPIMGTGKGVFDVSDEERKRIWEELWQRGGFNWSIGGFIDGLRSREANREQYNFWVTKTRERIKDPKKRDLLAPLEPPYYIGTKRPSLEQDYYECCDRDNVEITNSPIVEFTETGIRTQEKSYEFDVIAICTGYDAVTGGLRTMGIKGKNGVDLDDKWRDGVSTHLGMIVNGFPNMFIVYGPQGKLLSISKASIPADKQTAPTSLTNGPPFIELQIEWIVDTLKKQRAESIDTVEANQAAEDAWREGVAAIANSTLAIHTNSWYMGANIPGKKREFLIFMGGIPMWHQACQDALEGWKGFETSPKVASAQA